MAGLAPRLQDSREHLIVPVLDLVNVPRPGILVVESICNNNEFVIKEMHKVKQVNGFIVSPSSVLVILINFNSYNSLQNADIHPKRFQFYLRRYCIFLQ